MLIALASLGDIANQGLESIVDKTLAEDCLEIIFDRDNYSFLGCDISSNKGEEIYLYHKEPSGKPGLFLSWTISSSDIKRLQELLRKSSKLNSEEKEELTGFWDRKFRWFSFQNDGSWTSRNKLINDQKLLEELDTTSRSLLLNICKSYADSMEQILKEAERLLREYEFRNERGYRANKLLVSIAFKEGTSVKYPGDYEPFKRVFIKAVSGEVAGQDNLTCSVCNSQLGGEVHIPPPVEFLTQDQLVYVPDGDSRNKGKAMALCQECSRRLRAGQAFINSNLSFKILGSKLFFWLLPVLPELASTKKYISDLAGDRRPLYLRHLKDMCQGLDIITDIAHKSKDASDAEAWLTFVSIFCYKDATGHTRISGTAEGIYPSRLRELVEASSVVQRRYPYFLLDPKVTFSFPLLSKFFKEETSEATLTQIMESLFVKNPVNQSSVMWLVTEKVRSEGLTRLKTSKSPVRRRMKELIITALNALIVVEYLIMTGVIDLEGDDKAMPLTENTLRSQYVDEIRKFISSHKYLDRNDTIRSIFLTGVAVGVLLEVQMKEFGSYPFWRHLNRLELDLRRIASFYPQVKAKLVQYSKGKAKSQIAALQPMIEYIGANLDFETNGGDLDRNSVDLVFAVGLAEGYIIYHMVGGEAG